MFTGIGENELDTLLVTSRENRILVNTTDARGGLFIASYVGEEGHDSYLLEVYRITTSNQKNRTTFRNVVTGEILCSDKVEGDTCVLGNVEIGIGEIYKVLSSKWVTLNAGDNVRFNVIYDRNGNYMDLPIMDEVLPVSEYVFDIRNVDGGVSEQWRAYWENGKARVEKFSARCTDSDGGKNYYVKGEINTPYDENSDGYIIEGNGHAIDRCASTTQLNEYYCEDNYGMSVGITCPNECEDGRCIGGEVECTDSDGGLNYYVKGYVNLADDWDWCLETPNGSLLNEIYCIDSETSGTKSHFCPGGCEDGACLGAPECVEHEDCESGEFCAFGTCVECDDDGDVTDFAITLIDDDGFYTDEQTEEIEELLTETLRP